MQSNHHHSSQPRLNSCLFLASRECYLALCVTLSKVLNVNFFREVTKQRNSEEKRLKEITQALRPGVLLHHWMQLNCCLFNCQFSSYKNKRLFGETRLSLKSYVSWGKTHNNITKFNISNFYLNFI